MEVTQCVLNSFSTMCTFIINCMYLIGIIGYTYLLIKNNIFGVIEVFNI